MLAWYTGRTVVVLRFALNTYSDRDFYPLACVYYPKNRRHCSATLLLQRGLNDTGNASLRRSRPAILSWQRLFGFYS